MLGGIVRVTFSFFFNLFFIGVQFTNQGSLLNYEMWTLCPGKA